MPLVLLPIVLASATDALVALRRIGTFMRAEELAVPYEIDPHAEAAVDVDRLALGEALRAGGGHGMRVGAGHAWRRSSGSRSRRSTSSVSGPAQRQRITPPRSIR